MDSKVKYRSFSHWFSYHWGWFLGGAVVVLLVVQAVLTDPDGPAPDYVISWVGSSALSEAEEASISAAAADAGADQNGDGQVVVKVDQFLIDFTLSPDDYRYQDTYANHLKLLAQIQAGDCYLYLAEDPEGLQASTGVLQYLDGSIPSEADRFECANWESMCIPWQAAGLERPCWLGRRALFGKGGAQDLFPGCDELFNTLSTAQKGGTPLD